MNIRLSSFIKFVFLLFACSFFYSEILGAATSSPDEDSCRFSEIYFEQLKEFISVKNYLTKKVYPSWASKFPRMFFFDNECQFVLNSTVEIAGFKKSPQKISIPGFDTDLVFYRKNQVDLPNGESASYHLSPFANTSIDDNHGVWFNAALYPVWKKEFGDTEDFFIGMLAHEFFHPFQFTLPQLKDLADISESDFKHFYRENKEFAKLCDLEISDLYQAIISKNRKVGMSHIKHFFETRDKRRKEYFIGKKSDWSKKEIAGEMLEGTAEYLNYRVMTDAKTFPLNNRLKSIDPDYTHYKLYSRFNKADALKMISKTKSYVQKIGVYMVILLDDLDPDWNAKIFNTEGYGESLLHNLLDKEMTK